MVSSAHNVCPKGYYIAIVSTIAEREDNNHLELKPGLDRLGKIEEQFMGPPIPLYEPIDDGTKDNVFISKSYDATSHFETTTGKVSERLLPFHGEGAIADLLHSFSLNRRCQRSIPPRRRSGTCRRRSS